ncbi:LruC domain-containing protein [uncultured Croceitalea sp.]|uniref:LruC domain-containing protein n=1 Tax=uncultured Croceitalea sp. TaxID=1798908 RepID=UPI003305C035
MRITKLLSFVTLAILLSFHQSCVKDKFDDGVAPEQESETESEGVKELTSLQIPSGFEFSTHDNIVITINDSGTNIKYDVYAYNDTEYLGETVEFINDEEETETAVDYRSDVLNHILFSGTPVNGQLTHELAVPSYYEKLYVRRKEGLRYTSVILDIENNAVSYSHSSNTNKRSLSKSKLVEDYLFCVNGSAELFQVDPLDGSFTYLSDMPQGSFTAAIDQANGYLYSIGKSNPYPLMRYDIANDSWDIMGNVGRGGPRLEFNPGDGLLYFSTGAKLYTIDPNNANTLSTWNINGLHITGGGDLGFAPDNTIFLCSFSGLYRLELDNNNEYQSTRISADNLPFKPTSMTFDSNGELWLANSSSNSNLIVMDTQTGGWQYNYGPNSNTNVSFDRTINDLTTFKIIDEEAIDPDTDGDGITDSNDDFPEDADKAFEQFTPSKYGWGTVAFEDLWPFLGDYDFNDTAVNYRFVAVLNSENKAVQLDMYYEVTSDGAGLANGFGIEFENLDPNKVSSVVGTKLTQNYVVQEANGLEANQDNAVVILFDDHEGLLGIPGVVSLLFTEPITTAELGNAPFNPFLIVGNDRKHEIHLPNRARTSLGENLTDAEGQNVDPDGDFKTASGLPWAIDIIHNFKVPKERVSVNEAYNFFTQWAASGGSAYPDWYKDNPGYRNTARIKE